MKLKSRIKQERATPSNKKSLSGFAEFILNDKKVVIPFLITVSKWVGFILFALMGILCFSLGIRFIGLVFFAFSLLGLYQLYKFYFVLGGTKNIQNMSASELVYNKDKITFSGKLFKK